MLIIADEFAQLKDEQPEFIDQLVGAARIGRSLGIRLLLTTQNPSGVVTKQIATNTSYRFCLKVASRDDSMDLIGMPDAAYLPGRGAGFLKMGESQPIQFQSGYTGDQYATIEIEAPVINTVAIDGTRQQIVGPRVRQTDYTQLEYLVQYIDNVAKATGYGTRYQVWAPPLPEEPPVISSLLSAKSKEFAWDGHQWINQSDELTVPVGLFDDPANQTQNILNLPISERNNIAVFVGPGEARNLFSRTFVAALAMSYAPNDVQLLMLDFGASGSLRTFEELPHTIVVAGPHQPEMLGRINARLNEEMAQRAKVLGGLTFSSYRASAAKPLPRIVILIDNIVELRDQPVARTLHETIERVAQNGAPLGIHLVVLLNVALEASSKIRQQFGMTIGLGVSQDVVYDITNKRNIIVDSSIIGRGVASLPTCEVQIAAIADGGEIGQLAHIQKLIDEMSQINGISLAHQIREIPERILISQLQKYRMQQTGSPFELAIARNVETEIADTVTLGADGNTLLITGSARAGKSTLMHTIVSELSGKLPTNKLKIYALSVGDTQLFHHQHDDHTAAYETVHSRLKLLIEHITVAMEPHQRLYQSELDNGNPITRSQILERLPAIVLCIDTDRWSDIVAIGVEAKQQLVSIINAHRDQGLFMIVSADAEQIRTAKAQCELTALLTKQQYILMNVREEADFSLLSAGYMSSAERDGYKNGMRPGRGIVVRQSSRVRMQFGVIE